MRSLFLSPPTAILTAVLLLLGALIPLFHPAFRVQTQGPDLAQEPLQLEGLPKMLSAHLGQENLARMQDTWGFTYPPSQSVQITEHKFKDEARHLNLALRELEKEKYQRAYRFLTRHYNQYRPKVTGKGARDRNPRGETNMVLYGLFRYNRALTQFEMAANLRPGNSQQTDLLKKALYDLRRTVGTFERLSQPEMRRSPYWGPDFRAWEGAQLLNDHGDLPINYAYTNLALAYLRIGDNKRYPTVEPDYLDRLTRNVYGQSGTQLNTLVSDLVQKLSRKGRRANLHMYRLTLGLQNLEASGRGIQQTGEAVLFHYTTGLLLNQLYRLDQSVSPADAVDAFMRAANAPAVKNETPQQRQLRETIQRSALRELAVLHIYLNDETRFHQSLSRLEPGSIRDTIIGPDRSYGLLLTDLAQYNNFIGLKFDRIAAHLDVRTNEFKTGRTTESTQKVHQTIVKVMADSTFAALRNRFVQMLEQERHDEIAAVLTSLANSEAINKHPILLHSFQEQCWDPLKAVNTIGLNLTLRQKPQLVRVVGWIPTICLILLFLHILRFVLAHRKMAKRLLHSRYRADSAV